MNRFKRFLVVAFLLLSSTYVLLFCLRNTISLDIDLLFFKLYNVPMELAVVSSFILGGLCGILASFSLIYRIRKKYRKALFEARQVSKVL